MEMTSLFTKSTLIAATSRAALARTPSQGMGKGNFDATSLIATRYVVALPEK
jgi:hypothetical protein